METDLALRIGAGAVGSNQAGLIRLEAMEKNKPRTEQRSYPQAAGRRTTGRGRWTGRSNLAIVRAARPAVGRAQWRDEAC
jgi:hypothetical protein